MADMHNLIKMMKSVEYFQKMVLKDIHAILKTGSISRFQKNETKIFEKQWFYKS